MLSDVITVTIDGLDTDIVHVETDINAGLPALTVVGLPDMTVRESKERIRSAIENSGCRFPSSRITINLAPADTKKLGSHFDLPMAVGVYASAEKIKAKHLAGTGFLGELSLSGEVGRLENSLALVIGLKQHGIETIFLPEGNMHEASLVSGVKLYPVHNFAEVAGHLSGTNPLQCIETGTERSNKGTAGTVIRVPQGHKNCPPCPAAAALPADIPDFAEVLGQERGKRVMLISAAGRHDLSMIGPPGAGKSMLAKRMPSILPELTYDEMLEITKIYSIAGESFSSGVAEERPFRAPHHSATSQALVGGGSRPTPGEISLAHMGVLFLDELPEFTRNSLNTLRQPLEDGYVTISRASSRLRYPCDVILITAMNPCPCGYYGHPKKRCTCTASQRQAYFSKVSGPLRDRIDLNLDIEPVDFSDFRKLGGKPGKSSAEMRREVERVTAIQQVRYKNEQIKHNAKLSPAMIDKYCELDAESSNLLETAYERNAFSARAGNKIIKVARTIADLEASDQIRAEHIAEAISYRLPSHFAE
jgi:magnesium chelatase family protein